MWKLLFDRVAVQPGKPTTFGIHSTGIVFGLPGNPVSSFVQFELFVQTTYSQVNEIQTGKLMNIVYTLAKDYKRKRGERLAFVPVLLNPDNKVEAADYHGSAHINALPDAVGLMKIPIGNTGD